MKELRLDKILSHMGWGTRNEIRKIMKKGAVTVDGEVVKDPSVKVNPDQRHIKVSGESINYREYVYLMLNKPGGVISATEDKNEMTVIDLLEPDYLSFSLFPVGRLDKDTEGLLILTNDGKMGHFLTTPKKKVPKRYYALVKGEVTEADKVAFSKGVVLDDGYQTLPAGLTIIKSDSTSEIEIEIYEGKYHQVKRMFAARDKEVLFLKRLSMGKLQLDEALEPGRYRELNEEEIILLQENH